MSGAPRNRLEIVARDGERMVMRERAYPILSILFWIFAAVAVMIVGGFAAGARHTHFQMIVAAYSVVVFAAVAVVSGLESVFRVDSAAGTLEVRRGTGPVRFTKIYAAGEVARVSERTAPGGFGLTLELASGAKSTLTLFTQSATVAKEAALLNEYLDAARKRQA